MVRKSFNWSDLKKVPLIPNALNIEHNSIASEGVMNIVLAEDDADDVLIFKLALNELKIAAELTHVDNGDTLLTLLKKLLPDIVFLDINMPCKDGLSCVFEIRKNKEFDNLPIILISGHRYPRYIEDGFASGANYYLIKANNVIQLVENLKTIFSIDWKKVTYHPPINEFVIGNIESAT